MSLMKTLAKVAIGVAVAKGAQKMMQGRGNAPSGQVADDGLFRGAHSPDQADAQAGNPLEGMMDNILGGGAAQGGLGGLLDQFAGSDGVDTRARPSSPAGLEDLLGGLTGGAGGGGLGGLLGGLAGALGGASGGGGGLGDVLGSQFDSTPQKAKTPSQDQEAAAGLMLAAMLQAAKSDGTFDQGEQAKIMDKLGDVSQAERDFVNRELQKPIDVAGLANAVPQGMERQVYMMSVLGIDLDSQEEAKYLHDLASALHIQPQAVNAVHDKLGVPRIYR